MVKKTGTIRISILNTEYKVIFCWGDSEYCKKILKKYGYDLKKIEINWENYRGNCHYDEKSYPVITMPKYPSKPVEVGTLAHEAVHSVARILIDEMEDNQVREVFAHSVAAIVRGVLRKNEKI